MHTKRTVQQRQLPQVSWATFPNWVCGGDKTPVATSGAFQLASDGSSHPPHMGEGQCLLCSGGSVCVWGGVDSDSGPPSWTFANSLRITTTVPVYCVLVCKSVDLKLYTKGKGLQSQLSPRLVVRKQCRKEESHTLPWIPWKKSGYRKEIDRSL